MATSSWRHPTMADVTGQTGKVRCRCRRVVPTTGMLDVREIRAARPASYLCSPCVETLYRKEKIDRLALRRAKGAPEEYLVAYEAKLLRGSILKTGLPQHVWGEILARAMDAAAEKARRKAEEPKPVDPVAEMRAELDALRAKVDARGQP